MRKLAVVVALCAFVCLVTSCGRQRENRARQLIEQIKKGGKQAAVAAEELVDMWVEESPEDFVKMFDLSAQKGEAHPDVGVIPQARENGEEAGPVVRVIRQARETGEFGGEAGERLFEAIFKRAAEGVTFDIRKSGQ